MCSLSILFVYYIFIRAFADQNCSVSKSITSQTLVKNSKSIDSEVGLALPSRSALTVPLRHDERTGERE